MSTLEPVAPRERVEVIDVLRGSVLFAILIMNMPDYVMSGDVAALEPPPIPDTTASKVIGFVGEFLLHGKANAIFAFMFGLGLTIQMQRADERGQAMLSMHLRRMAILLAIGVAHALLLWAPDALQAYAIIGALLFPLRRASDRVLMSLAVLGTLIPVGRMIYAFATNEPPLFSPSESAAIGQETLETFTHGSYAEQVGVRVQSVLLHHQMSAKLLGSLRDYLMISTTVLLGMMAGRRRLVREFGSKLPALRKVIFVCLGVGLILGLGQALTTIADEPSSGRSPAPELRWILYYLSRPLLAIGYMGGIMLLFRRPRWHRVLAVLGPAGRMPLTNYLMQTVIMTTLVYNYGFGLYAKIAPLPGLGLALVIFAVQLLYGYWWFQRFRYGPLEWLWRGASYGKLPRLGA